MSTASVSVAHRSHQAFWKGLWRLADPKISLASLTALAVGAAFAARDVPQISIAAAVVAFLTIFAVEVGKNAANDLYDFRSGTDVSVRPGERTPFSGGKRVLVDHLLTEEQVVQIGWFAFTLAGALGIGLAIAVNPWLLLLGLAGAAIAFEYSAPPLKLSYRGLGELAVLLIYGPGLILGMYLLLTGTVTAAMITVSATMGLLIANVLLLNEFPDERPDREAGKKTLVVLLGRNKATVLAGLVFLGAFLIPPAAAFGGIPRSVLGSILGAPFAIAAVAELLRTRQGPPVRAQAFTLVAYVAAGIGLILTSGW